MMRAAIIAVIAVMLCFSPAWADNVKVLILDKNFNRVPGEGERLELLDSIRGDLIVGFSSYRGDIEVWRGSRGLYLINELPLEVYVEGVVKAETGADWDLEALKAQAVIVRTYALRQMRSKKQKGRKFHVTSTVLHQVYKGLNSDPLIAEAVRQTSGEVLTYDDEPIMAFYHSTSGGRTELPGEVFGTSYPYLKSVEAGGRLSPLHAWARRIPLEELEKLTGTEGLKDIKITSYTSTGRAKEVTFVGNPSEKTIKASELRRILGWRRLPSTLFSLRVEGGYANFEGNGWGHGVGLCQWTSLEMAKEGMGYRDILSYFYPGTALQRYENLGL